MVTWKGSISVARPRKKRKSLPGKVRLANVYATSEQKNSCAVVIDPVTIVLFTIQRPIGWSDVKNPV